MWKLGEAYLAKRTSATCYKDEMAHGKVVKLTIYTLGHLGLHHHGHSLSCRSIWSPRWEEPHQACPTNTYVMNLGARNVGESVLRAAQGQAEGVGRGRQVWTRRSYLLPLPWLVTSLTIPDSCRSPVRILHVISVYCVSKLNFSTADLIPYRFLTDPPAYCTAPPMREWICEL
jgi:hypothetical protein